MFENKAISKHQTWQGEELKFAPDASPEAFEHFEQYYNSGIFEQYDICSPVLLSYIKQRYVQTPKDNANRLYALPKGTVPLQDEEGNEFYPPLLRLSGETDFNFEGNNYLVLKGFLINEPEYLSKLVECNKQHNCLLNFSLIQSTGNMQGFKGCVCDDRLDKFIYYLYKYYKTNKQERTDTKIIQYAHKKTCNWEFLMCFLNQFEDVYDYCKKVYFTKEPLTKALIEHGKKELDNTDNVKSYIDLAYRFWEEKDFVFSEKEYLTIGSYFPDGGEVYSYEELSYKLLSDLGIDSKEEIAAIINKCVCRGFIYQCGNNCYTR